MGVWKEVNKSEPCPLCGRDRLIVKEWISNPGDAGFYYPHYLNQPWKQMPEWMKKELDEVKAQRYLIVDEEHKCLA